MCSRSGVDGIGGLAGITDSNDLHQQRTNNLSIPCTKDPKDVLLVD